MQQVQMSLFDLNMPYGKTSQAHSVATKAKISELSSKSFAKSKIKPPMFLDLRTGNGTLAGVSWETDIPLPGECLMQDFGECPSVVEESGLSQILEVNVPLKYYLSARACEGVLRRAERRGKELPEILEIALKQQIERWKKYGTPLFEFTNCICETLGFNHLNGSKAASNAETLNGSPTLRSNSPTSAVIAYCYSQDAYDKYVKTTKSSSLKAMGGNYGGGSETLVCAGFHSQSGKSAGISFNSEESPTLQVHKAVAVCCKEKTIYVVRRLTPLECCRLQGMPDKFLTGKFNSYLKEEDGIWKVNISANGAEKNLLARSTENAVHLNVLINCADSIVQVLKAEKFQWSARRVEELLCEPQAGKTGYIVPLNVGINQIAEAIQCNGKGEKDRRMISFALQRNGKKFYPLYESGTVKGVESAVRQKDCKDIISKHTETTQMKDLTLTTLFCSVMNVITSSIAKETLKGNSLFVSFSVYNSWASDIPHSDAQEYKMWGNGMALPNALYIMEGFENY